MYSLACRVSSFSKMSLTPSKGPLCWLGNQVSFPSLWWISRIANLFVFGLFVFFFLFYFLNYERMRRRQWHPLWYSCLENPLDRGAWWAAVHGVVKSQTLNDWTTSLSFFSFMHWRRKWQSTPVFLPGESQGQGRLVGCHLWGLTESDTTEAT